MLGELSRQQIERLLHGQVVGRLGLYAEGRTYVVPITYVYDGQFIYGHSADGMKVRMMRQNPALCFEVDRMEDMANWESVIAWGRYEELSGEEAVEGLKIFLERLLLPAMSESAVPSHGLPAPGHGHGAARTPVVFRIRLLEKTGRFERRGAPAGASPDRIEETRSKGDPDEHPALR